MWMAHDHPNRRSLCRRPQQPFQDNLTNRKRDVLFHKTLLHPDLLSMLFANVDASHPAINRGMWQAGKGSVGRGMAPSDKVCYDRTHAL
jgi:hypothetical protein